MRHIDRVMTLGNVMTRETAAAQPGRNFIRDIIDADIAAGRNTEIVTRFPP